MFMGKHSFAKAVVALSASWLALVIAAPAQTVKTLVNFDNTNGSGPYFAALMQGFDGKLYGGTAEGGTNTCTLFGEPTSCGVIFSVTTSGKLAVLHDFDGADGASPDGTLVQDASGNLYGVTELGGANTACAAFGASGCGTVFKITLRGDFTSLYSFCSLANCADGATPTGGLVLGADGNLYGTTSSSGANYQDCSGYGCGTIFKITTTGTLTTLHSFDGTDGMGPGGPLVQLSNGYLYGAAAGGGKNGYGTIFRITTAGKLTTLHNFENTEGSEANPLTLGTDGNFYSTATDGGTTNNSTCGSYGCGTVFKVTLSGQLTVLYNFCSLPACADGFGPVWSLMQASDGNLYGNTGEFNGTTFVGDGTIFKVTTGGAFTNLYTFNGSDGEFPEGAIMQATNGILYGTTPLGGADGYGTIFSLSEGLASFVETEPTSGKVGKAVKILGTDLTGSTSVTFDGTAATFTVVSRSEIITTVPTGATTGAVEVTTPSGILSSNVVFRVP
jgi:uncharacterized repeat protein (TIGR03803 family)